MLVRIPVHGRTIRLVVISIVMVTCATIHTQPPPLHATALPNAPAPSSAYLVPTKMKTIRLCANHVLRGFINKKQENQSVTKHVVPIRTVLPLLPVVSILLPLVQ